MIRMLIGRFLRLRIAFPVIVGGALVVLVVNDLSYRHTIATLKAGIELTDARIVAAQLMQRLTDAEAGQRGYLLTGQPAYLQRYAKATQELPALGAEFQRLVDALAADEPAAFDAIETAMNAKLAELAAVMELVQAGQRDATVARMLIAGGQEKMVTVRSLLNSHLARASDLQTRARVSIYDSVFANRMAVLAMVFMSVVGLYFFIRQLRVRDEERLKGEAVLKQEVRMRTRDLRHLARHLQTVQEVERAHLARELHDELGGLLTAAKLDLARIRIKIVDNPELLKRLEHAIMLLNDGIAFKRRVIEDLRPSSLSALGLNAALGALCVEMQNRLSIPIHLDLQTVPLNPPADLAVYRFVQEAITNIAKYAQAKNVWITLVRHDQTVRVEVWDDGVGFVPEMSMQGRHGLAGMQFRLESLGGSLTIASAPGNGTLLKAQFPLQDGDEVMRADTQWS